MTLQPNRFTQEERDTLEEIKALFGPEAAQFSMVLFTQGDQLQGKSIEDFLEESPELSEFVQSCRGGYQLFDNTGQDKSTEHLQVVQLLKKIDKMVADNGGDYYSNEMFKEAEKAIKKVQAKILREHPSIQEDEEKQDQGTDLQRRKTEDEEEARKRAERLFWCELASALGRGAAEGAGIVGKDKGKGVKKVKVVEKAAALAASPLSIRSAARVVEGAVREGSKVLYKHRKTLLHWRSESLSTSTPGHDARVCSQERKQSSSALNYVETNSTQPSLGEFTSYNTGHTGKEMYSDWHFIDH